MRATKQNVFKHVSALKTIEKNHDSETDELLEEMAALAQEAGDWSLHLPYAAAVVFFEDERIRKQYGQHVDACAYCMKLLDSLRPSDLEVERFGEYASLSTTGSNFRNRRYSFVSLAIAASIVLCVFAVGFGATATFFSNGERQSRLAIESIRANPGRLASLEQSSVPRERFLAAQYYFAIEQPQLAYRQIGRGLELAGVDKTQARAITTAADISFANAASDINDSVHRLEEIKVRNETSNVASYLEIARLQAKLGLHRDALESIGLYLKATQTDPQVLAAYSATAASNLKAPNGTKGEN